MSSANELEDEKVGALLTMYVAVKGGEGGLQRIPLGRHQACRRSTRCRGTSY